MADENSEDEPINDLIIKFKCDTYFKSLDVTIKCINDYFSAQIIGIYKDITLFSKKKKFVKLKPLLQSYQKILFKSFVNFMESLLIRFHYKKNTFIFVKFIIYLKNNRRYQINYIRK